MANKLGWEHDGTTFRIGSDDVNVLETPFAIVTTSPPTLVGQDPTTGLPVYCPQPQGSSPTITPPVPVPLTTCTQVRCGIAIAMVNHLNSIYEPWSNFISGLLQTLASGSLVALFLLIFDPPAWALAGAGALIFTAIKGSISGLSGGIAGLACPYLSPDQVSALQQAIFCQLSCVNDAVQVTAQNISDFNVAQQAITSPVFTEVQRIIITALLDHTPMSDWLTAAAGATASTTCDTYACP